MILTAFPTRSGIIRIFYYGEDGPEDPAIEALETYIAELDCNLEVIVKFYDEWGLEKIEDSSDKKKTGNWLVSFCSFFSFLFFFFFF